MAPGHHQAVLDRLVAVAVAQRDLVAPTAAMKITRFDIEVPLVTE